MRHLRKQQAGKQSRKRTGTSLVAGPYAIFCILTPILGCVGSPQHPSATQPVTVSDPATTQPSYWLDQPGSHTVQAADFELLASRIERTLRDYGFNIDRVDYRLGLITTEPLVSAQFFEPWRRDNQTIDDVTRSSLATHRRRVEVTIEKDDGGTYAATPKVVIERQTVIEHRITSVVLYKGAFKSTPNPRDRPTGTKESDRGVVILPKAWYAIGRDAALEKKLAAAMQSSLK